MCYGRTDGWTDGWTRVRRLIEKLFPTTKTTKRIFSFKMRFVLLPQNGNGNEDGQRVTVDAYAFQKGDVGSRFAPPENDSEGSREKPPITEDHCRRQRHFLEGEAVRQFRVHQTRQEVGEVPADTRREDEGDHGPQRSVQIRVRPNRRLMEV